MAVVVVAAFAVGLSAGAPLLAVSGFLGGFATGLSRFDGDSVGWFTYARHGFVAVGLGGILLVAAAAVSAATNAPLVTAGTPDVVALLLSPFGIVVYAFEGAVGGLLAVGARRLLTRTTAAG